MRKTQDFWVSGPEPVIGRPLVRAGNPPLKSPAEIARVSLHRRLKPARLARGTAVLCWEKGPTNLGIEESVTASSRDSDPVMVSLRFALDA